jgi:octaprenyl-diphosphate synthase
MVRSGAEVGRNFGMAFQIIDDLLDFGYGAENLDKRTFSDLKNGYFTLPLILFFSSCDSAERQRMLSLLTTSELESSQLRINEMLESHLCFQKARDIAVAKINACMPFLESLPENASSQHLRKLCRLMTDRSG